MIVRILGEGQLEVLAGLVSEFNEFDAALESAVEADDEPGFSRALAGDCPGPSPRHAGSRRHGAPPRRSCRHLTARSRNCAPCSGSTTDPGVSR